MDEERVEPVTLPVALSMVEERAKPEALPVVEERANRASRNHRTCHLGGGFEAASFVGLLNPRVDTFVGLLNHRRLA